MACKVVPLVKILLYNKGSEPYFGANSDHGHSWYSILEHEERFGRHSYNTVSGVAGIATMAPLSEYIGTDRMRTGERPGEEPEPIGLVLHPFIVPTDVGNWLTTPGNAGTFETARMWMNPPVTMLLQTESGVSDGGTTFFYPWGAESEGGHPANASFAFSLLPQSVSPEYNELVGGVPFYQISWSSDRWAIRFFHHGNPVLMKSRDGVLWPVMELSSPSRLSFGDSQEMIVGLVRVQRGKLMISMDHGTTYDVWGEPNGDAVSMPQGKWRFKGLGCKCALGIHEVQYVDSEYSSPRMPMDRARTGQPTVVRSFKANAYNGLATTITPDATLDAFSRTTYMHYTVALKRGYVLYDDRDFYYSPEVYAVELAYNTSPSAYIATHDLGATFDRRIKTLTIDYPFELNQATATWSALWTVEEGGPINDYDLRKVQIWGGWLYDDGSDDLTCLFTGNITGISFDQSDPYRVIGTFTAQSVAVRPQRMQWRDANMAPFDGYTVNQALARWCYLMGMDSTHYIPDTSGRGDTRTLPMVCPERPSFVPDSGGPRWDIMDRIARYCELELGVTQDGRYRLVPHDQWNISAFVWDAAETDPNGLHVESVTYEQRILDTYTGVLVRGQSIRGAQLSAWIYDSYAETDIFSSRFRPWPEWHVETLEYPTTPAFIADVAFSLAAEKITPHYEKSWKGPLANYLSRRDVVWVNNTSVGSGALSRFGVLTMRHNFDRDTEMQAWTEVTGRQV